MSCQCTQLEHHLLTPVPCAQIFQHQSSLFPPETLFYILLDDDMVPYDVVATRLSFWPPFLRACGAIILALWLGSAKWVLREVCVY